MITESDITRLMERPESAVPVASLFLDLRVGHDNRRTDDVFLAQQRGRLDELERSWPGLTRADLEAALDRAEQWVAREFEPANRGAAIYTEVGGDWLEAVQVPVPLPNTLLISGRPALAPLVRALQDQHHHAVALVDREHLRLFGVWLGRVLDHDEVRMNPYPAGHDVQGGGFAEQRYQRHKLEETRHFFTGFAAAVGPFMARVHADDLVLMGTDENVGKFRRFLPPEVDAKVAATLPAPVDAPVSEVLERLGPVLDAADAPGADDLAADLRERAGIGQRASTGLQPTLTALQAGSVEALLLGDDPGLLGGRCTHCGFLFSTPRDSCPYDGALVEGGVPVVEEALRLAQAQGARSRLVSDEEAREFAGAGALLRF